MLHRFDVRPTEAQKTLQTLNHRFAADIANGVADVSAQGGRDGARENNLGYDRGEGLQKREFGADEQKAGAHYNQRRGKGKDDALDDDTNKDTPGAVGADSVYDPIKNFSQSVVLRLKVLLKIAVLVVELKRIVCAHQFGFRSSIALRVLGEASVWSRERIEP